MRYAHILRELCFSPWLIDAGQYRVLWGLMESNLAKTAAPQAVDQGLWRSRRSFSMAGEIAEIHVLGTTAKGLTSLEESCGNTSYESIHADIDRAERENASAMIFNFETLGGHSLGIHDLAQRIRQHDIPSVAYTETYMCSAGYHLGAACDLIVAQQDAEVASIGCIYMVSAPSEAEVAAGLVPVVVTNREATLKTLGYTPMNDEHVAHLEERAQEKFDEFKAFVTASRSIPAEAMKGQSIAAGKGIFMDLVDEIGDYGKALEQAVELGEIAQIKVN